MDAPLGGLSSVTSIPLPASSQASDGNMAAASDTQLLRFRRIYILPTRQGMGFAVAVLVMLLGSVNYGNTLGYVLSFMLVGVTLVSMLHAVRNLSGLRLGRDESAPVFAGDTARFGLRTENRGQRQRFALLARLTGGRRRSREDNPVLHFHLDADCVKHLELPGVAARLSLARSSRW